MNTPLPGPHLHEGRHFPSPVERILALGYYDGPTEGVLRCGTGEVYRFGLLAWEAETQVAAGEVKGWECLAITAYAAKQSRKGDLASAKAVSLLPKAQQLTTQQSLSSAKSSASTAQQLAQQC